MIWTCPLGWYFLHVLSTLSIGFLFGISAGHIDSVTCKLLYAICYWIFLLENKTYYPALMWLLNRETLLRAWQDIQYYVTCFRYSWEQLPSSFSEFSLSFLLKHLNAALNKLYSLWLFRWKIDTMVISYWMKKGTLFTLILVLCYLTLLAV